MDFNNAILVIKNGLKNLNVEINADIYDGLIVKKLESSNTLDDGRTTHQTHIAITGEQMDIFPYLRADGYFRSDNEDSDLKKYFILQIPVYLNKQNIIYLSNENCGDIYFSSDYLLSNTSIIRSKRSGQSEQIQISLVNEDDDNFIKFRKLLQTGSYLIILKRLNKFEYDCFGVKSTDAAFLIDLNNRFYKLKASTLINVADIKNSADKEERKRQFREWAIKRGQEKGIKESTIKVYINALERMWRNSNVVDKKDSPYVYGKEDIDELSTLFPVFESNGDNRPFSSVSEMNKTMITNWNNVVSKDDTVYILGDFALNNNEAECASQLNGKKILLIGNHDMELTIKIIKNFSRVSKILTISDKNAERI